MAHVLDRAYSFVLRRGLLNPATGRSLTVP